MSWGPRNLLSLCRAKRPRDRSCPLPSRSGDARSPVDEDADDVEVRRAEDDPEAGARDEKGGDDKVIAVHLDDPEYAHYQEAAELPPHRLKEIQRFFLDYKVLENKTVDVEQIRGRAAAEQVIRDAVRLYKERIAPGVRRARAGRV